MKVTVPVNKLAHIYVPSGAEAKVLLNGQQLSSSKSVKNLGTKNNCVVVEAGSGSYEFVIKH